MSDYIIGGWSQTPSDPSPNSFSYTMYGMVTNLNGLTTGTSASPGWSPTTTTAPSRSSEVLWTYGGGGCSPSDMPNSNANIEDIVAATKNNGWAGVDIDDECSMDVQQLIKTMQALKPNQSSYTFLAGWDYNNPNSSSIGQAANSAVRQIAEAKVAERFILMCYAAEMWSMADIQANVGPAIQRTIDNGVSPKQVILALTPAGLNSENLSYFLNQVTSKQIGGLFIWNYPDLSAKDLDTIQKSLDIFG